MDDQQKQIALFSVIVISLSLCSADVFYQCADSPIDPVGSKFTISCNAPGNVIIVESAIIGFTDGYKSPNQCPITSNTCTMQVSFAAELCTGKNSCEIAQRLLLSFNESRFSCPALRPQRANFINVNYSCVYPIAGTYGDLCHFDGYLYRNSSVYISSYPNFPAGMPPSGPFQCLCSFAPSTLVSGSGGWVRIRTRLVKLSGFDFDPCLENLTVSAGGETRLSFCSPSTATNIEMTVSSNSMFTIKYERRSHVTAETSKFFIELKEENVSNAYTIGRMSCKFGSSNDPFTTSVAGRTSLVTFKSDSLALPIIPVASSQLPEQLSSTSTTTPMTLKSPSVSTDIVTTSSENQQRSPRQSALTPGAIAGIVIGSVAFLALILIFAAVFVAVRKKKNSGMNSRAAEDLNVNQTFNINSGIQINQLNVPCTVNGDRCNGRAEIYSAYEDGAPVELSNGPILSHRENGDTGFCGGGSERAPLSADAATICQPVESIGNAHLKSTNYRANEISPNEQPLKSSYSLVTKSGPAHSYYNITPINEYAETTNPALDASTEVTLVDNALYDSHLHHDITPDQTGGSDSAPSMQKSIPPTVEYECAETRNPVFDESAEVTLIDNTMYGSISCIEFNKLQGTKEHPVK